MYIFLITTILFLLYIYLKYVKHTYWKRHGVPHDEPKMLIGTLQKELVMYKLSMGDAVRNGYLKYRNHPFHGLYIFYKPMLMINDLDLIKEVLIKNFQCFRDRGLFNNEKLDPLSANLVFLTWDKWKTMSVKFYTAFTPSKINNMLPLIMEVNENALSFVEESLLTTDIIDFNELIGRYTIDTTISLSFGFNSNTIKNPDNIVYSYAQKILEFSPLKNTMAFCIPELMDLLRIPYFDRKCSQFFINLFNEMINKRKLEKENRNDLLSAIIDMMENEQVIASDTNNYGDSDNTAKASRKLTLMEAAAQAFIFFIAGYETTSASITYFLHEITLNPDIQEKLHKEIDEYLESPEISDKFGFTKLKYLDMVWHETLRKHPVMPILNRICNKDFQIPNSDYVIPKGMRIMISVSGVHMNPELYPDPEKFDPTRFTKEKMANMHPCQFLTFGAGPKHCVGKRLGFIQSKLIIFHLLKNYRFSCCEKTRKSVEYSMHSILQMPAGPVYLRVEKRKV